MVNFVKNNPVFLLDDKIEFPPVELSQDEPNGLLAMGGDLSQARLIEAYRKGIFPWYCQDEPIMWWSPDPRCVFLLQEPYGVHQSKSLKRTLKKQPYTISINRAFEQVIDACAAPRAKEPETWILPEMKQAYLKLHQSGYAHSVEAWQGEQLVGGLYGISMGKFFFGESMFSHKADASKIALVHLANYLEEAGFILIDSQIGNEHLYSLGAGDLDRADFSRLLEAHIDWQQPAGLWHTKTLDSY